MRRSVLVSTLATGALALGTVAFASPATADQTFRTFNATGETQSFTVPDGVSCIGIDAYGAAGGDATTSTGDPAASGGFGGRASTPRAWSSRPARS